MEYLRFYACSSAGAPAAGASVEVFLAGTQTPASLFDNNDAAISNPVTAGNSGLVGFAATNGDYDVVVAGGSPQRIYLFDPDDVDGATLDAQLSEITASVQAVSATAASAQGQASTNASGLSALSQSVTTKLAAAAAATALLVSQIGTANAQIAALTTTYGDTASAAASSSAAQGYAQAAQAAQANAQTAQSGALTAQSGAGTYAGQAQGYAQAASAQFTAAQAQAQAATTSASTAQGWASAANTSAAAAQTFYNLSATVGYGALNSNPTFASFAGTGSLPSGWADAGNGIAASSMIGGFDSPNAISFDCTGTYAGSNVGIQQVAGGAGSAPSLNYGGPGWYVLEVDIFCHSQANVQSAAVYVVAYPQNNGGGSAVSTPVSITLQVTPDINQTSGAVGGRRQYALLGYISSAGSLGVVIQPNGANGVTASSKNDYHKVLLRPASSAEIAGQQAYTTANTNTANLASFQSAQTSQNSAFSTSINSLNAAVFNASGGSLQSQITAVSQTQATQQSTFSSQITTLQSQVAIQPNMEPNGGFANGLAGWTTYGSGAAPFYSTTFGMQTAHIVGLNASGLAALGPSFPISASSTYTIAASLAADIYSGSGTVTSALVATFYDSTGKQIAGSDTGTPSGNYQFSSTGPSCKATITTPSNAATVRIYAAVTITGSSVLAEVYLGRVKCEPGAVYSGWSDDASAVTLNATVTTNAASIATLQGQLFASYTLTATAGNVITGLQLLSASGATTISAVVFQAENFLIKSSAASSTFSPFAYNASTGTLQVQNVTIAGNLIVGGTVTFAQMAAGAVTTIFYAYSNNTTSISVAGSSPPTTTSPPPGSGSNKGGNLQ